MKKKFSWDAFKKKTIMVRCTGTDVIRNFMAQAEYNGVMTSAIQHQLEMGKQEVLLCCKILDGVVYVAEPTPMFTTEDAPWLIDWAKDVVNQADESPIVVKHKCVESPFLGKTATLNQDNKSSVQQTDSKDSSANEAWDLMRHIYLMQPEEIIAVFGVPYNLVLAMEYAEVKKRYEEWHKLQRKDIVRTIPNNRVGIVIGEPITGEPELRYLVLFGDYSTGIFYGHDLRKQGTKAKDF